MEFMTKNPGQEDHKIDHDACKIPLKIEIPEMESESELSGADAETARYLQLVDSYEKSESEEKELLDIKRNLLMRRQALESKLNTELAKKTVSIAELKEEIPSLQNQIKQLGKALGVDVFE
jgi:hypothetical protein